MLVEAGLEFEDDITETNVDRAIDTEAVRPDMEVSADWLGATIEIPAQRDFKRFAGLFVAGKFELVFGRLNCVEVPSMWRLTSWRTAR